MFECVLRDLDSAYHRTRKTSSTVGSEAELSSFVISSSAMRARGHVNVSAAVVIGSQRYC